MNIEMAVDIIKNVIAVAMMLIGPFLLFAVVIGVSMSIIQAITSIQDQTLSFVPKLIGLSILMLIISHWFLQKLTQFTYVIFERMKDMAL